MEAFRSYDFEEAKPEENTFNNMSINTEILTHLFLQTILLLFYPFKKYLLSAYYVSRHWSKEIGGWGEGSQPTSWSPVCVVTNLLKLFSLTAAVRFSWVLNCCKIVLSAGSNSAEAVSPSKYSLCGFKDSLKSSSIFFIYIKWSCFRIIGAYQWISSGNNN